MFTHRLFSIPIDDLDDSELQARLNDWVEGGNHIIFTPNAEMLLMSRKEKWFAEILKQCDLSLPDAVSIRYAIAALTDERLKNRHTGVDTLEIILKIAQEKNKKVVLLGGISRTTKKAVEQIRFDYPRLDIDMINPVKIAINKEGQIQVSKRVIDEILEKKPSVLAVALGHGKQEAFIIKYIDQMQFINVAVGVGGAVDMIAGEKRRAPKLLRKMGFEWFWRLLIEPARIGRIVRASIVFPFVVACTARRQKRFWKAVGRVGPEIANQLFK